MNPTIINRAAEKRPYTNHVTPTQGHLPARNLAGGFLFVTFKGETSPLTEQVYFAVSEDGRTWDALNGGEPVLVSEQGRQGVRDPFIFRSAGGDKFFLIGTDLNIHLKPNWGHAVRQGSRSILVWESTDLVQWSEARLIEVAPDDAGCAWAPESIYDEERGDYLVFWASTTGRDNFTKHRIWASRTPDFHTFSDPFIYIERPQSVIDTTIVHSDGLYHRFSKDEKSKAITLEVSADLLGPWRAVPEFSLSDLRGYEGPQCFVLEPETADVPAKWCLMLDHYSKGEGYQPFVTTDLSSGHFESGSGFDFPFRFRHGSVLRITQQELQQLQALQLAATA